MSLVATLIIGLSAIVLVLPQLAFPQRLLDKLTQNYHNQIVEAAPRPKIDTPYAKTPIAIADKKPLEVGAKAALVLDPSSQKILFEKNSQQKLPMASLTKMMTALVIMNHHRLDETVTIPAIPSENVTGSQAVGVRPGEKFKLSEALRIMLIYSANDMATALAVWDAGSTEKFATKMNNEAAWWKLNQSHFVNPTGLDADGHVTSATDLARLARILLASPTFAEIVKTNSYQATSLDGKVYNLISTNQLLRSRNDVFGIKTGFDSSAGECLITLARRDGNSIITVVLNSPDRFAESQSMIEWAFANHTWQ